MAEFRKLRHLLEEQSRVINKPSFLLLMLLPSMRSVNFDLPDDDL